MLAWMVAMSALVRPGVVLDPPEGAATSGTDLEAVELERRFREDVEPLLAAHCFSCHGERRGKGGVRFHGLSSIEAMLAQAEDLERARRVLRSGEMPPEDQEQPSDHEVLTITQWLDDALAYHPADAPVDPGWFAMHRLNRAEYANTLRDLLGVDVSDLVSALPPDDTGYGFDNMADVLTVSPLHLETYLDVAEASIDRALGPVIVFSEEPRRLALEGAGGSRPIDGGGQYMYTNSAAFRTVDLSPGRYVIEIDAWGTRAGDQLPRLSLRIDREEVLEAFIEAERGSPERVRTEVDLAGGRTTIAAHFTNDHYIKDVADRNLAVTSIVLTGPLPGSEIERPEVHGTVFFAPTGANESSERRAARRVVERFASRAFRRPVRTHELNGLMRLYESSREDGDGYEQGVRVSLTAALVSPAFLYRTVSHPSPDDPGAVHRLTGYELASRLSYFLWSSMPDERLLSLAGAGTLGEDEVLRSEVSRMLDDPRAGAFVEHFAGQWLLLRNLEQQVIDPDLYPSYTSSLRSSMVTEATMFFGDVVRSNRSVLDLLEARDTFLNPELAALYGVEGVTGEGFRRVTLPVDSPRGGVLSMGAVLTVTSNPTRTSPVKRGLYVLDQLLGMAPPPPPPDVPPLEEAPVASAGASLREQLEAHVADPTCASCHRRMDPLGLAMERFDAIGRWRDSSGGQPIDARGELPSGEVFDGPVELKRILLERRLEFVENLTRRVLTYALGRGLEPFDRPTVRGIVDRVRADGDRSRSLLTEVVLSDAFRTCRGRP